MDPMKRTASRVVIAAVAGLTLLSAAIRLHGIGEQGLHFDEAFTLLIASGRSEAELGPPGSYLSNPVDVWKLDTQAARTVLADPIVLKPWAVIQNTYHYEPNHSPLYYLTAGVSLALFGNSEFALRLPSVLFGALTAPFIFLLGYRLKDAEVGLVAAGLFAFASWQVYYSQWARMYSLFILLSVASIWLLMSLSYRRRESRPGGRPMWIAYVLATAAGLYSYYLFAEIVAVAALYVVVMHRHDRPFLVRWLTAMGAAAALYLPWIVAIGMRHFGVPTMIEWSGPESSPVTAILSVLGGVRDFVWVREVRPYKVIWILSALFILGLGSALRTKALWPIVAWLFLPPAVVITVVLTRGGLSYVGNRYYLLSSPALYLLIALGVVCLRPRFLSRIVAVALAGYLMVGGYRTAEAQLRTRIQFKEAAHWISEIARPDDLVMLIAPTSNRIWGMNLAYYLSGPEKIVLARGTTATKLEQAFSFTEVEPFQRLLVATAVPYQGGADFDPKAVSEKAGFVEYVGQKRFVEIAVQEYRRTRPLPEPSVKTGYR